MPIALHMIVLQALNCNVQLMTTFSFIVSIYFTTEKNETNYKLLLLLFLPLSRLEMNSCS